MDRYGRSKNISNREIAPALIESPKKDVDRLWPLWFLYAPRVEEKGALQR